jgi:hypothetical protein
MHVYWFIAHNGPTVDSRYYDICYNEILLITIPNLYTNHSQTIEIQTGYIDSLVIAIHFAYPISIVISRVYCTLLCSTFSLMQYYLNECIESINKSEYRSDYWYESYNQYLYQFTPLAQGWEVEKWHKQYTVVCHYYNFWCSKILLITRYNLYPNHYQTPCINKAQLLLSLACNINAVHKARQSR